jgi:predicted lysophospholipase L1 biosynthesis ABC-type transport system permease subunit
MPKKKPPAWEDSTILARAILHDRAERRKWLIRVLLVPIAMIAIGIWGIDGWIWQSPWRVLLWWGSCAVITCLVMLFALYDALAVIREERAKSRSFRDEQ